VVGSQLFLAEKVNPPRPGKSVLPPVRQLLIEAVIGEVKHHFKFAVIASYHSRIATVSEAEIYA
jgi:hypothetical protein